jgi:hypothetical protein
MQYDALTDRQLRWYKKICDALDQEHFVYRPPKEESFESEEAWFRDRAALERGLLPLQNIHHAHRLWLCWRDGVEVPRHIRQCEFLDISALQAYRSC